MEKLQMCIFSELFPVVKLRPFEKQGMEFCKCRISKSIKARNVKFFQLIRKNQRTSGPVNAHLLSWPSKAQNIQNLENIWQRNDLDLQYSHTFIISISCLHLPTFRSQAAIVSEKSTVFTFSHRKA